MKNIICLGMLWIASSGAGLLGQSFISAEIIEVTCFDNNTPTLQEDDILTFGIQVEGTNVSDSCFIELDPGTTSVQMLAYGAPVYLEMQPGSAGGGNVEITLTDQDDPLVFTALTLFDPGFCSFIFPELQAEVLSIECLDNETPGNSDDDIIQFTIQVEEPFPSYGFDIIPDLGYLEPFIGFYNQPQIFTFEAGSAGNGDRSVMLMDIDDPGYMTVIPIPDPGACSTVATNDVQVEVELEAYPNPARAELTVHCSMLTDASDLIVQLFLPNGQLLGTWDISPDRECRISNAGYSGFTLLTLTELHSGRVVGRQKIFWE
jgi:hypothetical protein